MLQIYLKVRHVQVLHVTMEDVVPTLAIIHLNADVLPDSLEIDVKLKVRYVTASCESITIGTKTATLSEM